VALGSLLAVLGLAEVIARAGMNGSHVLSAVAVGFLAVGTTLPLAFLGAEAAAVLVLAAAVLSLAGFHTLSVAGCVALLIVLFRVGRLPPQHGLLPLAPIGLSAAFLVLVFTGPSPSSSESAAATVVLAVLAPLAGLIGITAQARAEAKENRAARELIADTLIEHTARSERARIARELHDVVAHHISMVAVQAEAARLTVPGMPTGGAQRLSAIGDTARTALVEMRRLLGVLREEAWADGTDRQPQPGLEQVTELIDRAREASGSATRLILRGTPVPFDPSVELVAYRIVQEGLTNVMRHAPGAAVDVELTYADAELRLRVRDNGPGPDPSSSSGGHGVAGMHERAAAVGGSVRTGLATGGGYLVDAVLPVKIEDPA
jgi:signal transduction histidine kinase